VKKSSGFMGWRLKKWVARSPLFILTFFLPDVDFFAKSETKSQFCGIYIIEAL